MKEILKQFGKATVRGVHSVYDDQYHEDLLTEAQVLITDKFMRKIMKMYKKFDSRYLIAMDITAKLQEEMDDDTRRDGNSSPDGKSN